MKRKFILALVAAVLMVSTAAYLIEANVADESRVLSPEPYVLPLPPKIPPDVYPSSGRTVLLRSLVEVVDVVGFKIESEKQATVTLKYRGSGTAPAVTLIVSTYAMPVPLLYDSVEPYSTMPQPPVVSPPLNQSDVMPKLYYGLIGSTVIQAGWKSPADMTLGLVGMESLFEVGYIQVLAIPYTGK